MLIDQKWRKLTGRLRREFPCRRRIEVRRVSGKNLRGLHGECLYQNGRFLIRINKNQSFALAVDSLLHEWAHVLTFHGNDTDDHGEEWGLAYARLYRAYLEWH